MATVTQYPGSYSDLPMEIILHIIDFLPPSDLFSASLTCRRWFDAAQHPKFASQIYIHIRDSPLLQTSTAPIATFLQSIRCYSKIVFDEVDVGQVGPSFWQHLGGTTQELSFRNCDIPEKKCLNILKEFQCLDRLEIENCREVFMSGCLLDKEHDRNAITGALASVQTLSLIHNRYMTDALLNKFGSLMPKLNELNLSGCDISFHNGVYRKFYPATEKEPSKCVLTFQFIAEFIKQRANALKTLDFSETLIDGGALTILARLDGLKLLSLKLNACHQLTNNEIINFMYAQQSTLVELELTFSVRFTDQALIAVAKLLTNLRVLKVGRCRAITDVGVEAIVNLKQLSVLNVCGCKQLTSHCIVNGLALTRNDRLTELYLSALNICEIAIMCIAKNLPNLRVLDLSYCKNGVTDVAVQFIFKHLRWLRILSLDHCNLVSDFGITGIDMENKLMAFDNEHTEDKTAGASVQLPNVHVAQPPVHINVAVGVEELTRISLCSRAEQEIVADAKRKQHIFELYEIGFPANASGHTIDNLRGLRKLDLTACNKISDVSLQYSFKMLELKELRLSSCQQITAIGIEYLVKNCPSLEYLELSNCHNITDKAITLITVHLKRLTHLYLANCVQLTDHCLDAIAVNCKELRYLDVNGCRSIWTDPNVLLSRLTSLRDIKYSHPDFFPTELNLPTTGFKFKPLKLFS